MTSNDVRKAVGYIRVSTDDQADSGAGLAAQRASIRAECDRRGWTLGTILEDTASGGSLAKRPSLDMALVMARTHVVDALVVAKLDRLTRSVADFAGVLERARKEGWVLVALDVAVDTSTPAGEAMASMMSVFAQFERRLIGQRTREALAQKRLAGVRLGRPIEINDGVIETIRRWSSAGVSLRGIAKRLTIDGVRPPRGGTKWTHSTIEGVVARFGTDVFPDPH